MIKVFTLALWLLVCCVALPGRGDTLTDALYSPSTAIQKDVNQATATSIANPLDTEQALAPFQALHIRYPENLFVHARYQDAVQRYGIEGHLKSLAEEYAALDMQHDSSPIYHYLYLRSLIGYSTKVAIDGLTEMVAQDPHFAPAHQSLAEIYGTTPFSDAAKAKSEREKFLSLYPKVTFMPLPPPLPNESPLIDQAEKLLAQHGNPNKIIALTVDGIANDEWRWQHINPHDWYNSDEKRKTRLDLKAAYWKAWSIQAQCCRNAGRSDDADALLARMDKSAISFLDMPGHGYWDALTTLVHLYAEAKHMDLATQKLNEMTNYLAKHPNPDDAAQLNALQTGVMSAHQN